MSRLDPPVDLGHDLDFLRELWALDHALQKRSKRMAADLGITGPQRLALRLVSRFPGLPAGRLAQLLHLHPSTVTGIVKRLEGRGLLVRRTDAPDRRRSLLQITPAGLALLSQAQPTVESALQVALGSLASLEVAMAMRVLATLTRSLEDPPAGAESRPPRGVKRDRRPRP